MKYFESDYIELKREITSELKKEIVAFLNTNGGIIYVNVDDDGNIYKNFNDKEKDIEMTKVINQISQGVIEPNPRDLISLEFNDDGALEIIISEGINKPYYLSKYGKTPKGVYLRFETSKFQATYDDIKALEIEANVIKYEDLKANKENLTFNYLNNIKKDNILTFINKYKYYTNLDFVLSDQYNNNSKLFVVDSKNNIIKKYNFKGSILKQIDQILLYFSKYYHDNYFYIFKESILNAFIHRDYKLKDNIRIEVTPYKVNFISPGGLNDLAFDFYNKKNTRNKKLKQTLIELKYCSISKENGLKRVYKLAHQLNIEPVVISTSKVFVLSIPLINSH